MMGSSTAQLSLETLRQQFPALQNKVYFNYGGQGPMPQAALDAIQQSYERIQQTGPFSGEANAWVMQEIEQTRQRSRRNWGFQPKP